MDFRHPDLKHLCRKDSLKLVGEREYRCSICRKHFVVKGDGLETRLKVYRRQMKEESVHG